MAHLFLTLPGL